MFSRYRRMVFYERESRDRSLLTVAINIGRYVSAAVINTILVIGRRSTIRTDGQSGYRRDAIGCIRVARGGTRGQSTGQ